MSQTDRSNQTVTIRSEHYGAVVAKLAADPIIQQMEKSLTAAGIDATNADWDLIRRAIGAYHAAGGQIESHIGGPAEAIAALQQARKEA